jgi:hypothetical protein
MSVTADKVLPKTGLCESILRGRVDAIRRAKQKGHFTRLCLPAPDEYSSPSYVEIFSDNRFAAVGEDVTIKVRIAGARRRYDVTDKATGETTVVQSADNYIQFIE